MTNKPGPNNHRIQPTIYEIRIRGHLRPQWARWFEDATITPLEDGDTLITCPVVDQAVLHGLLKKVRDLGLPLLSVNRVLSQQNDNPDLVQ